MKVSVAMGKTIKVGNFEFARIDVSIEQTFEKPNNPNQVYIELRSWVIEKLQKECDLIEKNNKWPADKKGKIA